MKQESLDLLKKLNSFARAAEGFWASYDKTTSNSRCDKYDAKFNGDGRFTVFKIKDPVRFDALTGYYGNSGCTTYGHFDEDMANKYFIKALNLLKRRLFEEMAKLAKEDAAKLAGEAARELEELQKLVEDAGEVAA